VGNHKKIVILNKITKGKGSYTKRYLFSQKGDLKVAGRLGLEGEDGVLASQTLVYSGESVKLLIHQGLILSVQIAIIF
jgi:hypothetical protein